MPTFRRRLRCERGQGSVEYAILLVVASLGVGLALLLLRDSLGGTFAGAGNRLDEVTALPGIETGGAPGGGTSAGGESAGDDGQHGHGHHGNGKGNSGNGNGNGGPNGRRS